MSQRSGRRPPARPGLREQLAALVPGDDDALRAAIRSFERLSKLRAEWGLAMSRAVEAYRLPPEHQGAVRLCAAHRCEALARQFEAVAAEKAVSDELLEGVRPLLRGAAEACRSIGAAALRGGHFPEAMSDWLAAADAPMPLLQPAFQIMVAEVAWYRGGRRFFGGPAGKPGRPRRNADFVAFVNDMLRANPRWKQRRAFNLFKRRHPGHPICKAKDFHAACEKALRDHRGRPPDNLPTK
jgi:hypothetical protein